MSEVWNRRIDKAWHDSNMRRKFEGETGLAPLAWFFDSDKKTQQQESGHTFAYNHCFKAWASKELGIQEIAPEKDQEFYNLEEKTS